MLIFTILAALFLILLLPIAVLLTLAFLDEKDRPRSHHISPDGRIALAIYNSRMAGLLNRFFRIWSLTIWKRIYFAPRKNDFPSTAIPHELCHVDQWHRLGVWRFLTEYIREWWAFGYIKNRFEVKARTAAGDSLGTV